MRSLRFLPIALVALAAIGALIPGRHSAAVSENDIVADITAVTAPATALAGGGFTVTVEGLVTNGTMPDDIDVTVSLSAEADCTLVPPGSQAEALSAMAASEARSVSKAWTVNCAAPTAHHFTAEICAVSHNALLDPNTANNCDSDDFQVVIAAAAVGGQVELHAGGSNAPAAASGSGSSSDHTLPVAAAVAGAIVVLAASGWYARRRWLR